MVTMWPRLRWIIDGRNALPVQNSDRTLMSKVASILSSGRSRKSLPLTMPALLMRMSTGPPAAVVSAAWA